MGSPAADGRAFRRGGRREVFGAGSVVPKRLSDALAEGLDRR